MWKWLGIAIALGFAAFASVMVMQRQEAGNWGDTVDHLPSGSAARLESVPAGPPPVAPDESRSTEPGAPDPVTPMAAPSPVPVTAPAAAAPPSPAAPTTPPPKVAAVSPPPPAVVKAPQPANTVSVDLAWAREPPEGSLSTAAYMVITSEGPAVDHLVSVSSPDAQSIALHETRTRGDTTEMVPVRALEFEPGVPVVLEPGGYHLMLDGLRHPLASGRKLTIFLIFEKAGTVQVAVPVGDPQHTVEPGGTE